MKRSGVSAETLCDSGQEKRGPKADDADRGGAPSLRHRSEFEDDDDGATRASERYVPVCHLVPRVDRLYQLYQLFQ